MTNLITQHTHIRNLQSDQNGRPGAPQTCRSDPPELTLCNAVQPTHQRHPPPSPGSLQAVLWAFYLAQYMAMILVLWVAAAATGLRTFTLHDPGVLLLFFFLWGQCMLAFSFMLTTFFTSPRTATVVLLLVTVLSVQAGTTLLLQNILNPDIGDDETPYLPYMWFPPLVLLRALLWLIYGAAFKSKLEWSNLTTYGNSGFFRSLCYMAAETVVMAGLTWYLEIVLVPGGNNRHPLFCVDDLKSWFARRAAGNDAETTKETELAPMGVSKAVSGGRDDEAADVKAERERAEAGGGNQAVRVLNFHKVFPASGANPPKVAVRDLSFAVNKNECFGLLGHNGAGKSTTINMLCGLFKPTSGKAHVAGFDLSTDMASIHEQMGVCPQHDVLWDDLTAAEHLTFYARLRKVTKIAQHARNAQEKDARQQHHQQHQQQLIMT